MTGFINHLHIAHRLAMKSSQSGFADAGAAVRAWPTVAQAAYETQLTLARDAASDDQIVERICLDATSMAGSHSHRTWPGEGPSDQGLLQVAAALRATANSQVPTGADAVREAQTLITSSLWMTAQFVGRCANDHSYDIKFDKTLTVDERARMVGVAKDVHHRLNAAEQLALGGMNQRQRPPAGSVAAGLRQAVATWDVQAHRALLEHRSTMVLHVLARHEALTGHAFERFVDQAANSGIIDRFTKQRLAPPLRSLPESWTTVGDLASEFSFATTPVPTGFLHAAADLRGHLNNAIHESTDEDHSGILEAMSGHLASSLTIAASVRDLIADRELRGPARAIARVIAERYPEVTSAIIDPVDVHRGVSIPLPEPARILFEPMVQRCFDDANEMVNRAAGLDTLRRKLNNVALLGGVAHRSGDVRVPQQASRKHSSLPSR